MTAWRTRPRRLRRAAVGARLGLAQRIVAAGGDGAIVARIDRSAHARSLGPCDGLSAGSSSPSQ